MPPVIAKPGRKTHPCFYAEDAGRYGRIHLPVAASCNIQCAYCRRDYDCPHESRPGTASSVLQPEEAMERLEAALEEMPHICVAAVAGPGDAFSDPGNTLRTFELIRRENPDIALCVSTNGLNVANYISRLCELDVRFVTITMNTIDPNIGMHLYQWVKGEKKILWGREAACTLISKQIEAIELLKAADITVKVNTVVVPGVNEDHIPFLSRKIGQLKVDLMNLIPLIPVSGTGMENICPPGAERMKKLRHLAGAHVAQMHYCNRCRSDAVGRLHESNARISPHLEAGENAGSSNRCMTGGH
jgi:nitrogen fixation protein NifB